jgi:ubiquitin-conjugating enzyme E2 D/E
MSTGNFRRVSNELKEITDYINSESIDTHRFVSINTINDNLFNMEVCFLGPKDSHYEESINLITINIPKEYPHKSPNMKFQNKIYHPNISTDGSICLDILKDNWKPIYTLRTVIMSLMSLLSDPNPDSPLNGEAARLYKDSLKSDKGRREYLNKVLTHGEKK